MNLRAKSLIIGAFFSTLSLLSTLSVSCGGGKAANPPTEDDFCSQKAEKECEVATTCSVPSVDCKTKRKADCTKWVSDIKTADAQRVFRPENISSCIAKVATVYNLPKIKPADLVAIDDVCNYVFQGAVAKLATCTSKYDCKDRIVCDKGLCADNAPKAKDALCADPGATCPTGQYCTMMGTVLKCVDKQGTGAVCGATAPCLETLRCAGGTCMTLLMADDKCCNDADCPTAAPYCNPYAGFKCGAGLDFATHSPSCAPFGDTEAATPNGTATCLPGGGTAGAGGGGGAGGTGGAGGAGGSIDAGAPDLGLDLGTTADHE